MPMSHCPVLRVPAGESIEVSMKDEASRDELWVEYDGRWHERSADERRWQRDRRERLERLGWTVIVLHDTDLPAPSLIVTRVHDALVRGGYTGPRPALTGRWHALFRARL